MIQRPIQILASIAISLFLVVVAGGQPTEVWRDSSPHQVSFVEVETGVKLEVLDWGGTGETIFLLSGHGDTAHVFDDFAPELARSFHVVGITRRGFGASSQPADGYNMGRLTEDIVTVADTLKIGKFSVVGHSIAGDEMNGLAETVPNRVDRLVYLEAAYDRVDSEQMESGFHLPHPLEQPSNADKSSPHALTEYLWKTDCPGLPEANVRATHVFASDGHLLRNVTPDDIVLKVATAVEHPAYDRIHSPVLAIYAVKEEPAQLFAAYTTADPESRDALRQMFLAEISFQQSQREKFRKEIPNGKVIELPGASHYVFISNRQDVLRNIVSFISQ